MIAKCELSAGGSQSASRTNGSVAGGRCGGGGADRGRTGLSRAGSSGVRIIGECRALRGESEEFFAFLKACGTLKMGRGVRNWA